MSNLKDCIPNGNNGSNQGGSFNIASKNDFFIELTPEYFKAILANCSSCNANGKCYIQEDIQKILDIKPSNMKAWPDLPD